MNTPLSEEINVGINVGNFVSEAKVCSTILELNACAAFLRLIGEQKDLCVIPGSTPPILDSDARYFNLRSGRLKMGLSGRGLTREEIDMLSEVPPDNLWRVVHSLFA